LASLRVTAAQLTEAEKLNGSIRLPIFQVFVASAFESRVHLGGAPESVGGLKTRTNWRGMSGRRRGRPNVNPDQDQHRRNRLLAALRPRDFALLEPHLQIVPIREGEFLHLPGDEIEQVHFLHRGIVSLMAISEDGDAIATASVGSEGAIGTIAGTGFVRAFTRAMVQAPGVASQIAVSHFRRAVSKSASRG
jgi:hypothetical protein